MTGWFVLAFSVSSLLICGLLYVRLRHQLIKEVDRFIHDETSEVATVLSRKQAEMDLLMRFEDEIMRRKFYPFFFQILDKDGNLLYISKGFKEIKYEPNERIISNARNGKATVENVRSPGRSRPFRIMTTPILNDGRLYVIQLGTHLHFVRKSLSAFKGNILTAFPVILAIGSLGGWILARKSLSPIGYIASKAQTITSNNLGERLTPRGTNDEMDGLIATINGMISRLEDSFNRLAEFTADTSHELKTPICALRGEAEVLLSGRRTPEEYQEGLAHLIERFDHLSQMINDLIFLSKSDSSQADFKMVSLRLAPLLKDVWSFFYVVAEQKKILLTLDSLQDVSVMGDKTRLQQLFTNLVDNATKYTKGGSIRIVMEKEVDTVVVKVVDTGIGIPWEEQKNIFKRFYRVDKSRSRESGGVGLGLSIAERIIHAHKGKIEVQSNLNEGSMFVVTLPMFTEP